MIYSQCLIVLRAKRTVQETTCTFNEGIKTEEGGKEKKTGQQGEESLSTQQTSKPSQPGKSCKPSPRSKQTTEAIPSPETAHSSHCPPLQEDLAQQVSSHRFTILGVVKFESVIQRGFCPDCQAPLWPRKIRVSAVELKQLLWCVLEVTSRVPIRIRLVAYPFRTILQLSIV